MLIIQKIAVLSAEGHTYRAGPKSCHKNRDDASKMLLQMDDIAKCQADKANVIGKRARLSNLICWLTNWLLKGIEERKLF
jgi:hypothetical protein